MEGFILFLVLWILYLYISLSLVVSCLSSGDLKKKSGFKPSQQRDFGQVCL